MATTYIAIATVEVGAGGASSIDFSSIPATYTDLCLVYSLRDTRTTLVVNNFTIKFNNNTSNYSERILYANGSSASSFSASNAGIYYIYTDTNGATSSTFASGQVYIPNYAGTNYKSVSIDSVTENNATRADAVLNAALWSNTSAVNQITLVSDSPETFVQYSTATLYGISNS